MLRSDVPWGEVFGEYLVLVLFEILIEQTTIFSNDLNEVMNEIGPVRYVNGLSYEYYVLPISLCIRKS